VGKHDIRHSSSWPIYRALETKIYLSICLSLSLSLSIYVPLSIYIIIQMTCQCHNSRYNLNKPSASELLVTLEPWEFVAESRVQSLRAGRFWPSFLCLMVSPIDPNFAMTLAKNQCRIATTERPLGPKGFIVSLKEPRETKHTIDKVSPPFPKPRAYIRNAESPLRLVSIISTTQTSCSARGI
jgi:hypothetical protein